jgi:glutathione S-transferase
MKLYSVDLSPFSAKVRMQVYAKGLSQIVITPPTGFLTPGFQRPTPMGKLPALELSEGDVIGESDAIAAYLEEAFPTPSLLGNTPRQNADVRTLARMVDSYLLASLFNITGGRGRPRTEGEVHAMMTAILLRGFAAIEESIDGRGGYACLGRLTLADCALVPALFMVENVLPFTGTESPIPASRKLAAYWASIQPEPAAARVLGEMRRGLEARRAAVQAAAG